MKSKGRWLTVVFAILFSVAVVLIVRQLEPEPGPIAVEFLGFTNRLGTNELIFAFTTNVERLQGFSVMLQPQSADPSDIWSASVDPTSLASTNSWSIFSVPITNTHEPLRLVITLGEWPGGLKQKWDDLRNKFGSGAKTYESIGREYWVTNNIPAMSAQ